MADQDYPDLYADMEESAQRTRAAAIAFEHVLGGPETDMVPVNGYPDQPTIAGRVKAGLDALAEPVEAAIEAAKRFLGPSATNPTARADGSPLQQGDSYFNTTTKLERMWNGTSWIVPNIDGQQLGGTGGAASVGVASGGNVQQVLDSTSLALAGIQHQLDNRNAYPFQFGAVGDGVTDDTAAWVAAIATGKLVDGLGKTYKISKIFVPNYRCFVRATLVSPDSAVDHTGMFEWNGVTEDAREFLGIDLHLRGNRKGQTNIGFGNTGDGDRCGFMIRGGMKGFKLIRCSAKDFATDGLSLFGAASGRTFAIEDVVLDQCDFQDNRRHGVSMDTARMIRAYGGRWTNNGNDLPGAAGHPITSGWYGARAGSVDGPQYGNGCDIESYGADINHSTHVEDVEFHGVVMTGNLSGGLKILPMPGSDVNIATWRPMKGIKLIGGDYDAGLAPPSAETSPLQVGAANLLPRTKIGVEDLFVFGAKFSSSFALNNVSRATIHCMVANVNGGNFKYHAFVQDSLNIDLNIQTPQPLAVYQDGSTITINKQLTGAAITGSVAPTVAVSGGTIASQTTTLVSSSLQAGQLYRINIAANMTLAVGSNLQFTLSGGRTVWTTMTQVLHLPRPRLAPCR